MSTPTDLQRARSNCRLNVKALATILLPEEQRKVREKVTDVLEKEALWDFSVRPHLNQTQLLHRSLQICKRLLELRRQHGWTQAEYREAIRLSDDNIPTTLHETVFISMIQSHGTDEQQQNWLPKCERYEYIGCYAQTELAHGSNVQGLLTTATYDPVTDEIIIDSGGVEGTKWWIGGAGVLANFALVQAILRVPRQAGELKSLGPHLFIVPIRDLAHHLPLPGVTVGDQGPKAYGGFGAMDNGYINFDKVRIARENMLMRFAKLEKGGIYHPAKHDKLSYGSMVALRASIPENMGWALGKAVTTAVRYCIARRQFNFTGDKTARETQVIYYASVKHRLFPILALSYAYILSGRELWAMFLRMLEGLVKRGDVSMLAEVHSLSTSLKVSTTDGGARGLEEARRTMGGHGFSWMGGVGSWFANMTPAQTYEGENYVIAQQTARALLKHLDGLRRRGEAYVLPESSEYLREILGTAREVNANERNWLDAQEQIELLKKRAAYLTSRLAFAVVKENKQWTDYSFTTFSVARAHAELYIAKAFSNAASASTQPVLKKLASLHTLSILLSASSDLLESQSLTPKEVQEMRNVYNKLVEQDLTVEEVVGLTDAFGFRDWELGIVADAEGKVYERMWEEVRWREGDGKSKRGLMKRWEGVTWEGVREEARKVLRHWKDEDSDVEKARL